MSSSDPITELATQLGATWPAIGEARRRSSDLSARLETSLSDEIPVDTSLVVYGSLARDECTQASDIDWTLLVDGFANVEHAAAARRIKEGVAALSKGPAEEGAFADLAFSHSLVHEIGGEGDTNRNTTRRILLLFESAVIGKRAAYDRVVRSTLRRYVDEDYQWPSSSGPRELPRFLLNDIVRFWRTLAVDFADKRRDQSGRKWAIRYAKLRLSRKLTFAAALLACYGCAEHVGAESPPLAVTDYLVRIRELPPLARLAHLLMPHPSLRAAAGQLFDTYDRFLALLNDIPVRAELETLDPSARDTSSYFAEVHDLGDAFDAALKIVFVDPAFDTLIYRLTKEYGLF